MKPTGLPELILFDYGETLAHEADFIPEAGFRALMEACAENPEGIGAAALARELRATFHDLRHQVLSLGIEVPALPRLNYLFGLHGLRFSLSPLEMEDIYWNAASPCTETPGMRALLNALGRFGIPACVLSNLGFSSEALALRLRRLYPQARFAHVLSTADCTLRKPAAGTFRLAARLAGCTEPEKCWFVGDSATADIPGAHAAGMLPVWYRKNLGCAFRSAAAAETPACPHWAIDEFSELAAQIEAAAEKQRRSAKQ